MKIYNIPIDWTDTDENLLTTGTGTFENVHISSGEAYDLILEADTTEYEADRTLTFDLNNADRTLAVYGDIQLSYSVLQDLATDASPVFAGATLANYAITETQTYILNFQNQDTGESAIIELAAFDGDTTDEVVFNIFGLGTSAASANKEYLQLGWVARNDRYEIRTAETGTGDVQDLAIYTSTNTSQLVLDSATDNISMSGDLAVTGEVSGGTGLFGATTVDSLTFDMTQDFKFLDASGRLAIQSQTSAQSSDIYLFTKDGDGTDDLTLGFFATGAPSDYDPGEWLRIGFNTANSWYYMASGSGTTGAPVTTWPIHLFTDANTTQLVLSTDNNVAMSGALTVAGNITINDLIIGNARYIGSVGDPDAIQIEADGDVVLTQDLTVVGTIGVGGAAASTDIGINIQRNISSAGIVYAGSFFTANSGAAAESYGTNATNYGSMSGAGNKTAYGGRFQSLLYGMDDVPTATVYSVRGGDFRAGDHISKTYTATGTGYFQLVADYAYVLNGVGDWSANPKVNTYGLFVPNTPTGYGTNHTHYAIYTGTGQVYLGDNVDVAGGLDVTGATTLGDGGTTNYIAISATGDLTFVGSGGLPYGCLDGEDESVVCTDQNTYYKVTFDTAGPSNNTTVSTANNEITVLKTGDYSISVTACFHSAVASDFELLVQKNTDPEVVVGNHLFQTTAVANRVENTAGSCMYALSADDVIHLWVRCTSAAGKTAIFDHISMNCIQVGG